MIRNLNDELLLNYNSLTNVQYNTLMNIIKNNKDCDYGKLHNFDNISNINDFLNNVPISEYSDFENMIYNQMNNKNNHILSNEDFLFAFVSSGTTGKEKIIPCTKKSLSIYDNYANKYKYDFFNNMNIKNILSGKMINLSTCSTNYYQTKTHCVSDHYMARNALYWDKIICTPIEACFNWDECDSLYLQSRFALEHQDATYFYSSFISFIYDFIKYINNNYNLLINDIRYGTIDKAIKLPEKIRIKYEQLIKPNPDRANYLSKILTDNIFSFKDVWPNLQIIEFSGSGSMKNLSNNLINNYFNNIDLYIRGIAASEGIFTVPINLNSFDSVITLDSGFYEFLEYNNGITPNLSRTYLIEELEIGKEYELIVTNYSGLYRYRTHDVFKVNNIINNIPSLEFICRENVLLNICDEKITEETINNISKKLENDIESYVINLAMGANLENNNYEAFIELSNTYSKNKINYLIEKYIIDNISYYTQNVKCHRLNPLKTYLLKNGAFNDFVNYKTRSLNKSNNQIKFPKAIVNEEDKLYLLKYEIKN